MKEIKVVMYHYVIDYAKTKYQGLKGMDVSDFDKQLKYLTENYSVISLKELDRAFKGEVDLPDKCAILTFDDGYKNQYDYAFPIIKKYGVSAAFFVGGTVSRHKIFDVNKIHYILATTPSTTIYSELLELLKSYKEIDPIEVYKERYYKPNRFDTAEVIFIKRMLQLGLPKSIREEIADKLFAKYVSEDEESFAKEIYMSGEMLKELEMSGMIIGMHSSNHEWLNSLSYKEQEKEIYSNHDYLEAIGIDMSFKAFCYPYGAYNDETIEIIKKLNCALAVTTEVGPVDVERDRHRVYQLARYDCNDITKEMNSLMEEI